MTRAEVQAAARTWVGVPYRHAGRSERGLDCIGLVVVVARHFNVPHVDHQHYTAWPDPHGRLFAECDQVLVLRSDEPREGTIGVFRQDGYRLPCHVGIFTRREGSLYLVHAMLARRRVVEEPFTESGLGGFRLIRRYAFPALED